MRQIEARERSVDAAITASNGVVALRTALESPPIGTKNDAVKVSHRGPPPPLCRHAPVSAAAPLVFFTAFDYQDMHRGRTAVRVVCTLNSTWAALSIFAVCPPPCALLRQQWFWRQQEPFAGPSSCTVCGEVTAVWCALPVALRGGTRRPTRRL